MSSLKEFKIPAIREGTVIDHIPSRVTLKVMRILDLREFEHVVSVAFNLESKSMGKKGIIKIGGRFLTQEEVDKVAILAPNATVNIIKDYRVEKKIHVHLPDVVNNIVKCSNPSCITNNEEVKTRFEVVKKDPLKIRCHYCERSMESEDIKLV